MTQQASRPGRRPAAEPLWSLTLYDNKAACNDPRVGDPAPCQLPLVLPTHHVQAGQCAARLAGGRAYIEAQRGAAGHTQALPAGHEPTEGETSCSRRAQYDMSD